MPLHKASPQRQPQQGKTATRDRLPAQVFTRGTTGAVTVKTQRSEGTSVTNTNDSIDEHSRSSRSQTRDPSPRPPRTRRRSSSARRTKDERGQGHRSVSSGNSLSDQGSAVSPASYSHHRRTSMDSRDAPSVQKPSIQKPSIQKPSIQKPSPQKPGSRDSSPAPSIDSQKLHIKATKKVIDGTFPLISMRCRGIPPIQSMLNSRLSRTAMFVTYISCIFFHE
jgi:hypothetical protein